MMQDLVDARRGDEYWEVQVILATHSPLVLSYLRDASQVLLVHRKKSGSGAVTRLDEAPRYAELAPYMSLGELWYNAGEEHLLAAEEPRRKRR